MPRYQLRAWPTGHSSDEFLTIDSDELDALQAAQNALWADNWFSWIDEPASRLNHSVFLQEPRRY